MNVPPPLHPTDQILSSYSLGKLDDQAAEDVGLHLEHCADCRERVAEMSADSFLDRVRAAQKPSEASRSGSGSGQTRPGRTQSFKSPGHPASPPLNTVPPELTNHPDYEIKKELGRGGMGVVYLAHNTLMGRDEVLK